MPAWSAPDGRFVVYSAPDAGNDLSFAPPLVSISIASLHGSLGAAIARVAADLSSAHPHRPEADGAGSWLVPMSLILDGFGAASLVGGDKAWLGM
jgi:hypothetical protein